MIIPEKHIKLDESIIFCAANVIPLLDKQPKVDKLFNKLCSLGVLSESELDKYYLSLDLLYACNQIDLTTSGRIYRASN